MALAGWRLGVLLRQLADEGLHGVLGYASVREYAVTRLASSRARSATSLVGRRLARRLAELPALSAALEEGTIGCTRAREIALMAAPETEAAWLS